MIAQQPQYGGRLARVGQRRQHHADPAQADAGGVQQHAATRDHHEAQQGLDDVRIDDVGRPGQQRADDDVDLIAEVDPEVRAEPTQVLLVAKRRARVGVFGHRGATAQPPWPDVADPDDDVGRAIGDPLCTEELQLGHRICDPIVTTPATSYR